MSSSQKVHRPGKRGLNEAERGEDGASASPAPGKENAVVIPALQSSGPLASEPQMKRVSVAEPGPELAEPGMVALSALLTGGPTPR